MTSLGLNASSIGVSSSIAACMFPEKVLRRAAYGDFGVLVIGRLGDAEGITKGVGVFKLAASDSRSSTLTGVEVH